MQTNWKERVSLEKEELDLKIQKLSDFIKTDRFFSLSENQRRLLWLQEAIMLEYSDILKERVQDNG